MEYVDIKTPEELLIFMDGIQYGFVDDAGIKYGSWDEDAFEKNVVTKWKLSCPEKLIQVGYGHCFDQVELERDWFSRNGYSFKTYYIMFAFDEPNDYSTHTFLIYEENGEWKIFEHADYFNKGIHKFATLEEALLFEMNHHIEVNRKYNEINEEVVKRLRVVEYTRPVENVDFQGFIDNVVETGKDITSRFF